MHRNCHILVTWIDDMDSLPPSTCITSFHRESSVCGTRYQTTAYTGGQKIGPIFVRPITLLDINRFTKLFYCQNQQKICNNTIAKDPTTPQVCRYTTL